MSLAMRRILAWEGGRFLQAFSSPDTSLARSKCSLEPSRLRTMSGSSSTRSKVVKRRPQAAQARRRRMVDPSSDGRESTTRSSSKEPQKGQRTASSPWPTTSGHHNI